MDEKTVEIGGMKFKEIESFPPNENPFLHDFYNMGVRMGKNVMIMMGNHDTEVMEYLIIVNTDTGKRVRVMFE